MNQKIAIIGTVGVPANYGGFETLAENLLDNSFQKFTVYCSSPAYEERMPHYKNSNLVYLPLKANGIQSIPYDIISILHAVFSGHQKILVLGISGAAILPFIRIFSPKTKIITNIDGLEWKREKWGAITKFLLKSFEKIAVKFSTGIICDNQEIKKYVKHEYKKNGIFIAYGGDHALIKPLTGNKSDYFLSICRIEPENNIHIILESFSKSKEKILFIGNWNSSNYGKHLKSLYSNFNNINLIDPIFCKEKLFNLRDQCFAYIHGHSAGGTNPSLVEAMHFSKPIISFDCAYNRSTLQNQGVFFKNTENLIDIISRKNDWIIETRKIKEIAEKNYTWEVVRQQYLKVFSEDSQQ